MQASMGSGVSLLKLPDSILSFHKMNRSRIECTRWSMSSTVIIWVRIPETSSLYLFLHLCLIGFQAYLFPLKINSILCHRSGDSLENFLIVFSIVALYPEHLFLRAERSHECGRFLLAADLFFFCKNTPQVKARKKHLFSNNSSLNLLSFYSETFCD